MASGVWKPGDHVALQGVWRGQLWYALATTVVYDRADSIALHIAPGAPRAYRQLASGAPMRIPEAGGTLVETAWVGGDALYLARFGVSHAVMLFWEAGHTAVRSWYINLQDPISRTPIGFAFTDHLLDIVVAPDRSSWRWKDEDELAEAVARGLFSPEQAASIRAEGERAVALMKAGSSPYRDGWERWAPDPSWPIPAMPAGWRTAPA